MNSKLVFNKALSMCLMIAIIGTYSMAALANSEQIVGELLISAKNINGQSVFVKVNDEAVQSGRSIFSQSTIVTPNNASAIINFGKVGKIELAPDTTLVLSFNQNGIGGDLLTGRVSVLSAESSVNITTTDGNSVELKVGESAAVGGKAQTTSSGNSLSYFVALGVIVASLTAVVLSATTGNSVGGGTAISPTR